MAIEIGEVALQNGTTSARVVSPTGEPRRGAAGLRKFVSEWRQLRPLAVPIDLRLDAFVRAWRALPRPSPPQTAVSPIQVSVEGLGRVLNELKPALDRAKASGAFINVWRVAGLGRSERRAADALAWLLQPRGDHGLGIAAIEGLFDALQVAAADCPRPADLTACSIRVEDRPLNSDRDRVDLVVDHPQLLVFVEIKVDSVEGRDQLLRYVEAAENTARCSGHAAWRVVYLTRSRPTEVASGIIPLLWRDLASAVNKQVSAGRPASSRAIITQLLDHFAKL